MDTTQYAVEIAKELEKTVSLIDKNNGEKLAESVLSVKKIFVAGAGRSGFMVKAFAMRLMHMGIDSYVVGETVTPNIEETDLFVIGSGSGETGSLVAMANKAKRIGAKVALVSIFSDSTIGRIADLVVQIPAPTPKVASDNGQRSIQPMGSLFEQSLLITLDSIILRIMEKKGFDSATMFCKHANLE